MVTLHVPFFSEEVNILYNKYLAIYDEQKEQIFEARKEFEANVDIA
jgi:hypothetical protein